MSASECPERSRPRVVIVGAGFAGLSAARRLGGRDVDVLVVDRNNYHRFSPLLYQVATAGLEPVSVASPIRPALRRHRNVRFRLAEVRGIDYERCVLLTDQDAIPYDYLILALGSETNYFGNESLRTRAFGLKDIDDASDLRNHILAAFERAAWEPDEAVRRTLLTFVVVGGGPTGIELAGALAELIDHPLKKDFPTIDIAEARVVLVEATDRILPTFPERLQRYALRRLASRRVTVMLEKIVADVREGLIVFGDGTELSADTVVWTAGVRAPDITRNLGTPLGPGGRVKVEPTLNVPGRRDVFVVGDISYLEGYAGGKSYPMLAPVAIQQGRWAADNILALLAGKEPRPFAYRDKGQLATIGRKAAVMDAFGVRLTGTLAWLGWLFLHLVELIGFRNRLVVLVNWAYNYVAYTQGIRVLTRPGRGLPTIST